MWDSYLKLDKGSVVEIFIQSTVWKDQPVPKEPSACVSVAAPELPVGVSNQYLRVP
jgi:hypothetical protein